MSNDNSEFICEVVKVYEVSKHPNADKLSVVKVGGKDGPYHYTLVSGDTYSPGDLAVLVGIDSMVPVDRVEWEYCKKRLDYKPGSSHYRIRRAKLRGIATDGVLVSCLWLNNETKVGDDVSQRLGILKYETPSEQHLKEHPGDAQTVDRGATTNARLRRLIPDYSVTNMRKVPGLFEEGEEVEVSEKIHGSNIRFGRISGKLFVGSHHAIKSDMRTWWRRLWDKIFRRTRSNAGWYGTDIWSKWVNQFYTASNLPEGYVFYGEIFGPGIQKDYDYGKDIHTVRVFDVWDVKNQCWLDVSARAILCSDYNILQVPVHFQPFNLEEIKVQAEDKCEYTDGHIREGVIVKSVDGKRRGKWVSDKYREVG